MFDSVSQTVTDPRYAVNLAGLIYVNIDEPGIGRRRAGKGFSYVRPDGGRLTEPHVLDRIRHLVIPPAWRDVWISTRPNGHIQAVGYDERGRKQYLYHPQFRAIRDGAKFEHMIGFAEALPALRKRVAADMARHGLPREKVLATVVHLLETTMIRVGNLAYAKTNGSFGLTTLRNRHVRIEGGEVRFHFKGKSGKVWNLGVRDRRIARIVKACQELPGQDLFQYLDESGARQTVTSSDINAYLKDAAGTDITAKDFRTWLGTVLAANALTGFEPATSPTQARRNLNQAIKAVAERLGNTVAVCRKCYVHPEIMAAYLDGALALDLDAGEADAEAPVDEAAVLAFLRGRLERGVGNAAAA
jgi:DNA topoisomerase-1